MRCSKEEARVAQVALDFQARRVRHCRLGDSRGAHVAIRSIRTIVAGQSPVTAVRTASVLAASRLMQQSNVGALMVLDGMRLIGIFTERDALFRVLAGGLDPAVTTVGEVMTRQPQTIHPDKPFLHALRMMHEGKFRHLPVVEYDRPLGMVSVRDALDEDLYDLRVDLMQRANTE
jgi:CBS domain-containing protein